MYLDILYYFHNNLSPYPFPFLMLTSHVIYFTFMMRTTSYLTSCCSQAYLLSYWRQKHYEEQEVKHLTAKSQITPQGSQVCPATELCLPHFPNTLISSPFSQNNSLPAFYTPPHTLTAICLPFRMSKWQHVLWLVWIYQFVCKLLHLVLPFPGDDRRVSLDGSNYLEFFELIFWVL